MLSTPFESAMYLSDFHAARKPKKQIIKLKALEAMMLLREQLGISRVDFLGDMADDRERKKDVRKQCDAIKRIVGNNVQEVLRGNHDKKDTFSDAELEDLFGCAPREELITADTLIGLVKTHGHISGARKVKHLLRESRQLLASQNIIPLERQFAALSALPALHTYSSVGHLFQRGLEMFGVPADDLYEVCIRTRDATREAAAELLRTSNGGTKGRRIRDQVADIIEVHSFAADAELARITGSWGTVQGHRHDPKLRIVMSGDPVTDVEQAYIVGDCGSFVSDFPPTCITAAFPEMTLWEYDIKKHVMRIVDQKSLSPKQADSYLQSHVPPQAA